MTPKCAIGPKGF